MGNTGHGAERLPTVLASPAEWVSPGRVDGFGEDPPAWNEEKVSLLDTAQPGKGPLELTVPFCTGIEFHTAFHRNHWSDPDLTPICGGR